MQGGRAVARTHPPARQEAENREGHPFREGRRGSLDRVRSHRIQASGHPWAACPYPVARPYPAAHPYPAAQSRAAGEEARRSLEAARSPEAERNQAKAARACPAGRTLAEGQNRLREAGASEARPSEARPSEARPSRLEAETRRLRRTYRWVRSGRRNEGRSWMVLGGVGTAAVRPREYMVESSLDQGPCATLPRVRTPARMDDAARAPCARRSNAKRRDRSLAVLTRAAPVGAARASFAKIATRPISRPSRRERGRPCP